MASTGLSFENPVFASYAAYAGLLLLKMLAMSNVTGYMRFTRGVFNNPEDAPGIQFVLTTVFGKKGVCRYDNPDVERARRLHRNDLENIPAFLIVGLLYVLTGPSPGVALWHFRVFTAARYLHTVIYLLAVQPWRAVIFAVGFLTTVSMAVQVLMAGAL